MTGIALRPATPADSEFCYQLHGAAMGEYVTAAWGWEEAVQREFHQRAFRPDRWQIITADGTDVGMIDVEYRAGEVYLARIEIQPAWQGRGIGSAIISSLEGEARQRGQDLVLDVLAVNHRAQALPAARPGRGGQARPGNIKVTKRSTAPRG